jgi:SAM-dependent methyltransferase
MTLAPHCVVLIEASAEIAACIARAGAAWPDPLSADQLFGPSGLSAMSRDELLRVYLENSRVIHLPVEKFVTALRFALLEAAVSARADTEFDEHTLALYCALARQCFVTEYAFLHTDQEIARVNSLREALGVALQTNEPISAVQLAAVGAYMSLRSLPQHEKLLARSWPEPVEALLTQQIREPAEESRLRETIPPITPIEDDVSLAVRNQYESNPYPRWVAAPVVDLPVPINRYIRNTFPLAGARYLPTDGGIDMLIAGCGTGQSLVDYANRFTGARVLAVDLSLTSLAYAKRKIEALGLRNVELGQADLLKLGSLDRTFDVINCGGVLHHLGDPWAGWKVLLSLLRPNGFMSIALYSDLARADYVAAQKMVIDGGYQRTPDDIRRFRRDLITGANSTMRSGVLNCPDFYSVSECRDLLFHVQEHRMTIPQLKTFIEQNDLSFVGFDLDRWTQQLYRARFPDDPALTNLDNWHVFEQELPKTFISMYQFWVQKGRASA